jgi:acetylornithine/N-succinyldiaminopimelate aminotransferase
VNEVGALLIIDEIQPGFGRTGKLFGFQNYNIVPDVVIIGKGMGGGMPVGGFVASCKTYGFTESQSKIRTYHHFWRTPCHSGSLLGYFTRKFDKNT